jgi:glutamate/tyrosine decarboxylase-like PLP-dependent enzyme
LAPRIIAAMHDRIEGLRRVLAEPLPHPDAAALRQAGIQSLDWLLQHLDDLPQQPVGRRATGTEMHGLLSEPPPRQGIGFARAFAEFRDKIAPYAMRLNHPRFLAFIPSAPTFYSAIGDFLCAGTNFFCGVWIESAGPSQVERVVLDWFGQLLGLAPGSRGLLTSGGSEANLTALVTARETLAFDDRKRAVLYLTEQRHASMDRAAKIIGLSAAQVKPLAVDRDYRMRVDVLVDEIVRDRTEGRLPWLVCANAGATNTGSIDPLATIAGICRQEQLWFHIDAAYGWPAVLVPEEAASLAGIEQADSVTLDPHKWLAQSFESGCLLVRNGSLLIKAFHIRPDYMQDVTGEADEVNFADQGLSLTRRFRALKVWLSLKTLGLDWFREVVRRSCQLAELAQLLLERAGCFEILCSRRLGIVCFRFWPKADPDSAALDQLNLALVEDLRLSGVGFISSTRLDERTALRFCFVNWRTTAEDIERVVSLLAELGAKRITAGFSPPGKA